VTCATVIRWVYQYRGSAVITGMLLTAVTIHMAVSIGHGDTMLRNQLIEDLDRLLPA
jgi:hypothetical protein